MVSSRSLTSAQGSGMLVKFAALSSLLECVKPSSLCLGESLTISLEVTRN